MKIQELRIGSMVRDGVTGNIIQVKSIQGVEGIK